MRTQKLLAAVVIGVVAGGAYAVDAPHDGSFTSGSCDACHKLHSSAPGGTLGYYSNNDSCITCHNASPSQGSNNQLGLPWQVLEDQATPGTGGVHHRWDATALAPGYGAKLPVSQAMLDRVVDGKLQCATCHDPHRDDPARAPGSMHASLPLGVAVDNTFGSGVGKLRLDSLGAVAVSAGYRLMISSPGQYVVSRDFGKDFPTWSSPMPFTVNVAFGLDALTLTFTVAPSAGDYWDFYVGYPRLRQSNVGDAMCVECHADRVQSHAVVGAETTNGTTYLSHPVGAGTTLGANGGGYDLAPGTMLDATGVAQSTGDGNKTNDLVLDGGTTVRCTTCHAPHGADSNSLTVDKR